MYDDNTYGISQCEHLAYVRPKNGSGYYKLVGDIEECKGCSNVKAYAKAIYNECSSNKKWLANHTATVNGLFEDAGKIYLLIMEHIIARNKIKTLQEKFEDLEKYSNDGKKILDEYVIIDSLTDGIDKGKIRETVKESAGIRSDIDVILGKIEENRGRLETKYRNTVSSFNNQKKEVYNEAIRLEKNWNWYLNSWQAFYKSGPDSFVRTEYDAAMKVQDKEILKTVEMLDENMTSLPVVDSK